MRPHQVYGSIRVEAAVYLKRSKCFKELEKKRETDLYYNVHIYDAFQVSRKQKKKNLHFTLFSKYFSDFQVQMNLKIIVKCILNTITVMTFT